MTYKEIIAKNSMHPLEAESIIQRFRNREKVLMAERTQQIEDGLRHETESARKDREILGEHYK
jgi:TPP-dependent indolepyruvate ferredoxin oxidoreductase alpha subunit